MARDSNGVYTLPAGNPVISGTIIASDWANTTMPDLGNEITNSLSRGGEGGMLAPFKKVDGIVSLPADTWNNEVNSGWYRAAAGEFRFSVAANDVFRITASGAALWDGVNWNPIVNTNFFQGADPTLADTNAALVVGGNDPNTEQHLEIGPTTIQSKSDATTTSNLLLNALGGNTILGPSGAAQLLLNTGSFNELALVLGGSLKFLIQESVTRFTGNTFYLDSTDAVLAMPGNSLTNFAIQNQSLQMMFSVDGPISRCHANDGDASRFSALELSDSNYTGPNYNARLSYTSGIAELNSPDVMRVSGESAVLESENSTATEKATLLVTSDYGFDLTLDGVVLLESTPASLGGLNVNNALTGTGLERVMTTSDVAQFKTAIPVLQAVAQNWVGGASAACQRFQDPQTAAVWITTTIDVNVIGGAGDDVLLATPLPVDFRPLSPMSFTLTDTDSSDSGISTVKCTIDAAGGVVVIRELGGPNYTVRHTGTIMYTTQV